MVPEHTFRKIAAVVAAALLPACLAAQSHISTQSHQSAVTAVAPANAGGSAKTFFSAGDDGFIIKWTDDDQGEHYQISDLSIRLAAASPDGTTIAVYETDGGTINRVSVWNFKTLTRIYARRFADSVTSLSYSAAGTYLIAGTATVDGAVFMNASDGSISDKIKDPTGIISYASTSSSEKSLFTYSPAGFLSYFNMQTGKLKMKVSAEQSLSQVSAFNSFKYLCGVKDSAVYIVDALTGKTVASYAAARPVILADASAQTVCYIESGARSTLTLKELVFPEGGGSPSVQIIKNFKWTAGDSVTCGAKEGNAILLGSASGSLFRSDDTPSAEQLQLYPLTQNIYDKIYDMAPAGEDFLFLTKDAVYQSSYDSGTVNKKAQNPGQTQVTAYTASSIILWSKGTRKPVQMLDLDTKELTDLFTPASVLQSVRISGDMILEMESNATVNCYHFDTKKLEELYTGTGLQDAAIIGDYMYIAKSSATNPDTPLLKVNTATKETVPVPFDSNVMFSLCSTDSVLYGISVASGDDGKKTTLFTYDPADGRIQNLLNLSDEDTDAFTFLHGDSIYTNIGRDRVFSYDTGSHGTQYYNRSASLPLKVCQNSTRLVVLNRDGSISWYTAGSAQVLADWYLTRDGAWFEF